MASLEQITTELATNLEQSISVIVARKGPQGGFESAKLALAQDAAEGFRDLSRDALDDLRRRAVVPYTADAELDGGEAFVIDDPDGLAELADLGALASLAATLPTTPPRDLDLKIQFYGVALGDDSRVLLVRRTDPRIAYRAGRWLAIAGERLTRIEEPAFSFSPGFDLLIGTGWAVILHQAAFERLFRDIGLVDKHVRAWVTGITDHLPMDPASKTALLQVARDDSRTWRRLREIRRRGHLSGVDLAEVRRYAKRVGLDPSSIVRNGKLAFDPADRFSFLHLLNEDLYRGPLTDETFEAQRKSATGTT